VPASRMRLTWLLARWYRTGNIEALLAMRGRKGLSGRARGLIGGLARIGLGTAALLLVLPHLVLGGRLPALRRLYTICRGLGMMASVFGRHRNEYRTLHGA
jgi:succinoglycan biosynthesis protein ExoM